MHKELKNLLSILDSQISSLDSHEIIKEFENIPLDVFGRIQIDKPSEFPNICNWMAEMPSSEIQTSWTGSSGHQLMTQSLAFIKTIVNAYNSISDKPLKESSLLDFGCGWGRLIRLISKYMPENQIHGVDPWPTSIKICQDTNVRANLYISEYIPRDLPTPPDLKFDFIMAFSVYTHLSEKVTKISIETLKNHLTDTGILAITIRPDEYWDFRLKVKNSPITKDGIMKLKDEHKNKGFAFFPHNREAIEGEVTYGDSSMSLDYIKSNFSGLEIVGVEYNEVDQLQLIVFLTKSKV